MRRPRFIAEQARHARGLLGRAIAFIMARETWGENERAMAALDLKPSDHVIDIGCGHGRALGALAARAAHVVGADPSDLMAEIAVTRNRDLVKAGKVQVMIASAADLPFEAGAFDKALCVHVIYFWKDLRTSFREIARVMKPNGRFVLVFRTDADEAAAAFPADVYSFRSLREVAAALNDADFAVDPQLLAQQKGKSPALLVATKREAARTPVEAIESREDQHAR
jgi:SAM-dependent methyltransferase